MKKPSISKLVFFEKEVIVQHEKILFKLLPFAEIEEKTLNQDIDEMFKKYYPMLLKEGE